MVLIISESNDLSTNQVIEWLEYYQKKWIRINSEETIELEFRKTDIRLKNQRISFNLNDLTSVWYRRGFINLKEPVYTNVIEFDNVITDEFFKLKEYLYYKLGKLKSINSFVKSDVNRLIISDIAKEIGLLVPYDYIFSNKKDLLSFLKRENLRFITKSVGGSIRCKIDKSILLNFTTEININDLEEDFFHSLIQNYIDKRYELRIFYFLGEFSTMAIFSQNTGTTQIDFRNIDSKNITRYVPFKLPDSICQKLDRLMRETNINCGSIDMIVTPNNEFVFLEINPVGQFGMVSHSCNFNLEKKIAEFL